MKVTSRIIKGGALLDDTRRLVEGWDEERTIEQNLDDFRAGNLLAKSSRARAEDTLQILRQRFVDPGLHVVRALRVLARNPRAFREACYYEASRNDNLLAFVAEEILFDWRDRQRFKITTQDLDRALLDRPPHPALKEWGEQTRVRVAHGLLSALRDFGVLEGKANKRIATSELSVPGFTYTLARLREAETSTVGIIENRAWRRWLLEPRQVRALLLEADREGIIRFSDAGSVVRIDWRYDDLEEIARVVA